MSGKLLIPTDSGPATRTPENQVAKDINDLRTYTNAPEGAIQEAEKNASGSVQKDQPKKEDQNSQ